MSESDTIRVGAVDSRLYLHVGGKATHLACRTANAIADGFFETAEQPSLVVDLEGCAWVDSTMAGWLLRQHRALAARGGTLTLSRCSDQCRQTLRKMSVDRLFQFDDVAPPSETREIACAHAPTDDGELIELMLACHEELAGISGQNADVFEPIVRMLRKQLDRREAGS